MGGRGTVLHLNFFPSLLFLVLLLSIPELSNNSPEASLIVPDFTTMSKAVHVILSILVSFLSLLCFLFLFNDIPKTGWDAKK